MMDSVAKTMEHFGVLPPPGQKFRVQSTNRLEDSSRRGSGQTTSWAERQNRAFPQADVQKVVHEALGELIEGLGDG